MFKKRTSLILVLAIGFIAMPLFSLKAQTNELFNFYIFRRGNGAGDILVKNTNQELILNCGEECVNNFKTGDNLILSAKAREGSRFVGWSINQDSANIEPIIMTDELEFSILSENKIHLIYPKFELTKEIVIPPVDKADLDIPRVMFWPGKVNQHWDLEKKVWATDSDGFSGSRENKLEYCRKFYPNTEKVVSYKEETINTWKDAGNRNSYASTKMSYRCVLEGENVIAEDMSNATETPSKGSVCYWFPNLPLCLPLNHPDAIKSPLPDDTEYLNTSNSTEYDATPIDTMLLEEDKKLIELAEVKDLEYFTSLGDNLLEEDTTSSSSTIKSVYEQIIESITKTFQKIGDFFNKIFSKK